MDSATSVPQRGVRVAYVILGALLVLILVPLGATSPRPDIVEILPMPPITLKPLPASPQPAATASLPTLDLPDTEPIEWPAWLGDLLGWAAVLAIVGVVAWFGYRLFRALAPPPRRRAVGPTGDAAEVPDIDEEQIAEAAREGLESLRRGADVSGTVIECWRRLESAAADSGIRRHPAQTSEEFIVDVLARAAVDARPLRELGALYRRAMFSTHEQTSDDRDRAIDALEALTLQLAGGSDG